MCQFNDLMRTGQVPTDWQSDWRKTSFKMLPKTIRAKVPSEYRPIATIRLFYKLFAYMILGRVETQLETHQPEEQHGFRWQACGRAFGNYTLSLGQTFQCRRADLDCQPGLVEGFRPSTLASIMARSSRTRPFRTHDLDDPKFISRPTGASCWHSISQHYLGIVGSKGVLTWQPQGHRRSGRPKYSWDTLITNFCRWKNLPSWEVSAIDVELWRSNLPEFLEFYKC